MTADHPHVTFSKLQNEQHTCCPKLKATDERREGQERGGETTTGGLLPVSPLCDVARISVSHKHNGYRLEIE